GRKRLVAIGDWTVWNLKAIDDDLRQAGLGGEPALDVSRLGRLDTAGAFAIERTLRADCGHPDPPLDISGYHETARRLILIARESGVACEIDPPPSGGFIAMLDRAGRGLEEAYKEALGILAFVGEATAAIFRLLLNPHRIRWTSVVAVMEDAGLDALPIVTFLSFFIGMVIAFLGASLLATFGASVFTVEMVGILMLREFGVLLTAILLAGRTDSAFTAQIGAMRMRQEVDAMRVLGLDPMEVLVAPRLLALVVMTPFLAFAATVSGIVGGAVASWATMDISPAMFVTRMSDNVPGQHFWVGLVKAPVFALVVGLVGCRQGLLVESDVQSLGKRTTSAVVQSIFLVIVLDAIFALLFLELGI
ncbi:MAG: ABC transporter permease, partial [Pseudomonadota bacterium]